MPFGLGGVRADMSMYGGPDNAYWGGEALPDGASALTGVSDSPQDQGVVGLVFDASFYDNSTSSTTSPLAWRHYDPTGRASAPSTKATGNSSARCLPRASTVTPIRRRRWGTPTVWHVQQLLHGRRPNR